MSAIWKFKNHLYVWLIISFFVAKLRKKLLEKHEISRILTKDISWSWFYRQDVLSIEKKKKSKSPNLILRNETKFHEKL